MNHPLLIHTLASNVAKIQRAMPEAGQQGRRGLVRTETSGLAREVHPVQV